MPQIILRLVVPIAILGGGIGAMLALGMREQPTEPPLTTKELEVETTIVQPHADDIDVEVDGIVAPFREIEVAAEVSGQVVFKAQECQAGAFVRKDTLLIKIDPQDYDLGTALAEQKVSQAMIEAEEADVEIANTEALLTLAKREVELQQNELDRLMRLGRTISQSELDRTERSVLQSQNARQLLDNQLLLAKRRRERIGIAKQVADLELRKAELDAKRSEIYAPVDGVIVRDSAEKGSFVQRGSPLFTIEDTSATEVQCSLTMQDLYWLWRQNRPSSVALDSMVQTAYEVPEASATVYYQFAGRDDLRFAWEGELASFDGIGLDQRTRTVPCRIVIKDPRDVKAVDANGNRTTAWNAGPPALVRGMYVTVALKLKASEDYIRIPHQAVLPGKMVWLVEMDAQKMGTIRKLGPLSLIGSVSEFPDGASEEQRYWLSTKTEPAPTPGSSRAAKGSAESLVFLKPGSRLVTTPMLGATDGMNVIVE